jgi:hypothetical protein
MTWIIGVVILILAVSLFRRYLVGVVLVAIIVGGFLYFQDESSSLTPSDLALEDIIFKQNKLSGRLKNNSKEAIVNEVYIRASMLDCINKSSLQSCLTIAEYDEYLPLKIPPGQARDFEADIRIPDDRRPRPKGEVIWKYSISMINGKWFKQTKSNGRSNL